MITAKDFLTQASDLLSIGPKTPNPEVYHRSAVSRGYYAIFHEARSYLMSHYSSEFRRVSMKHTPAPNAGTIHRIIPDVLFEIKKPTAKKLGLKLKEFRDKRNEADYDLDKTIAQYQASQTVTEIGLLFAEIKKL